MNPDFVCFQGWASLYPFIRKQIVLVTTEDVLNLTHKEKVKFSELSDQAREGLEEVGQYIILVWTLNHCTPV